MNNKNTLQITPLSQRQTDKISDTQTDTQTEPQTESQSQTHYLARVGKNWQAGANKTGAANEASVEAIFQTLFQELKDYEIISKPKNLDQCFLEYQRAKNPTAFEKSDTPTVGQFCYDSRDKRFKKWNGKSWVIAKEGMIPDHLIRNKTTGKSICLEDKKQNDFGNAHERACKYATPKVTAAIQAKLGITTPPVCWVFFGKLAEKTKYQHELAFCLDEELFVLISPTDDKQTILVNWFNTNIRPFLD